MMKWTAFVSLVIAFCVLFALLFGAEIVTRTVFFDKHAHAFWYLIATQEKGQSPDSQLCFSSAKTSTSLSCRSVFVTYRGNQGDDNCRGAAVGITKSKLGHLGVISIDIATDKSLAELQSEFSFSQSRFNSYDGYSDVAEMGAEFKATESCDEYYIHNVLTWW